jgi:hypothetical protein
MPAILYAVFTIDKKKIKYDLDEASNDSKLTGQTADVFTNVLNVKMFSSFYTEVKEFNKLIPNSELHFIDKCGHAPMMEVPETFNLILEKFLNNLPK